MVVSSKSTNDSSFIRMLTSSFPSSIPRAIFNYLLSVQLHTPNLCSFCTTRTNFTAWRINSLHVISAILLNSAAHTCVIGNLISPQLNHPPGMQWGSYPIILSTLTIAECFSHLGLFPPGCNSLPHWTHTVSKFHKLIFQPLLCTPCSNKLSGLSANNRSEHSWWTMSAKAHLLLHLKQH